MKFGFDIDDTLINLRGYAFELYKRKLGVDLGDEVLQSLASVEIHEPFGLTREQGKEMWNSLREDIYFTSCPPFPFAVEVLQELAEQGHEVYYITARAKEYCARTLEWLRQNGFPVRGEHFYCGMEDTEKVHIIERLGLDYYFDDKPAVLNTLSGLQLAVYAKDNPYNKHLEIPRITSWHELREIVRAHEK
ncbi:hypothetical protein ACFFK0_01035 [Paenibacillus chartarius]|uniref:Nucleotidase n=1 Tax=Paenibacillus chartarius TaxID=747481 RepID=A0ABV6DEK1_9BACL